MACDAQPRCPDARRPTQRGRLPGDRGRGEAREARRLRVARCRHERGRPGAGRRVRHRERPLRLAVGSAADLSAVLQVAHVLEVEGFAGREIILRFLARFRVHFLPSGANSIQKDCMRNDGQASRVM